MFITMYNVYSFFYHIHFVYRGFLQSKFLFVCVNDTNPQPVHVTEGSTLNKLVACMQYYLLFVPKVLCDEISENACNSSIGTLQVVH